MTQLSGCKCAPAPLTTTRAAGDGHLRLALTLPRFASSFSAFRLLPRTPVPAPAQARRDHFPSPGATGESVRGRVQRARTPRRCVAAPWREDPAFAAKAIIERSGEWRPRLVDVRAAPDLRP